MRLAALLTLAEHGLLEVLGGSTREGARESQRPLLPRAIHVIRVLVGYLGVPLHAVQGDALGLGYVASSRTDQLERS